MTIANCTSEANFTAQETAKLLGKEVQFLVDKPLILGGQDISKLLGKPCFEWRKGEKAKIWQAEYGEKKITLNLVNKDDDIIEIDRPTFVSALKVVGDSKYQERMQG